MPFYSSFFLRIPREIKIHRIFEDNHLTKKTIFFPEERVVTTLLSVNRNFLLQCSKKLGAQIMPDLGIFWGQFGDLFLDVKHI